MRKWPWILLLPTLLSGQDTPSFEPWFTGPFLAPSAVNMEIGHPALELGVNNNYVYGFYNKDWELVKDEELEWTLSPFINLEFAISERAGIEVFATYSNRYKNDQSFHHFQDTLLFLGYQILDDQKDSWVPNFRIHAGAILPTGAFDGLEPDRRGIDAQGQGAYFFGPVFAFSKLFYLPNSYLNLHWSFATRFPLTRANLRGISAYGGDRETRGHITPGQIYTATLSFEYAFAKHFAFAMDTFLFHQLKTSRFKGVTRIPVGLPPATQVSLTPSLEYSFNADAALMLGSWFTVAGRHSDAFASLFLAFFYTF